MDRISTYKDKACNLSLRKMKTKAGAHSISTSTSISDTTPLLDQKIDMITTGLLPFFGKKLRI
ncbi:MAG TPA: hypothetical protein VKA91_05190 [Nitrososphaeraceae archaeon]|nr:hypothetical protein [Nitrososphaeraceae archaeon]